MRHVARSLITLAAAAVLIQPIASLAIDTSAGNKARDGSEPPSASVPPAVGEPSPSTAVNEKYYQNDDEAVGAWRVDVEVTGKDRQDALAQAHRKAVLSTLVLFRATGPRAKAVQALKDQIVAQSSRYVLELSGTSDGPATGGFKLKANCYVAMPAITRLFLASKLATPWRVGIVLVPPLASGLSQEAAPSHKEISSATDLAAAALSQMLSRAGFQTVVTDQSPEVQVKIRANLDNAKVLAALASSAGMDMLIIGTAQPTFGLPNTVETFGGMKVTLIPAKVSLALKVFSVRGAAVVSELAFSSLQPLAGNSYGSAATSAMRYSGEQAGIELLPALTMLVAKP